MLTINSQDWVGGKLEPTTMSDDVRELIVLPIALLLFLFAAQAAAGLTGRGVPPPAAILAAR